MNLYIKEDWIASTPDTDGVESLEPEYAVSLGGTDFYETFTDSVEKLHTSLIEEYGDNVTDMFVTKSDGKDLQTGWVFTQNKKYEDSFTGNDTYIQETWITVATNKPKKVWSYSPEPVSPWA